MKKLQTTKIYAEIGTAVARGFNTISLQGSSRSSKTYNTLLWLIVYCLNHPGLRLSIVRATLPAIKGSVFVDFKEILQRMGAWDERELNKSELTYHFPNGSWVEFFSTDSEQKLRGRKRDILFVNEANELRFIEWQQLKMRTTTLSIIDYNPSFSDDHWICSLNADPKTYHFISTYKDNPFLEPSIVEEIESLQHKNKSLWQVYGLGKQAVVEGLVFPHVEECDIIPPHIERTFGGVDFGFTNDPTAVVEVAFDRSNLYVRELAYQTRMLTADIVDTLRHLYKGTRVISESADPRLVEEIFRAGINIRAVRKFPGSIEAGLAKMQEYTIHIVRGSPNILKEFKNYAYEQDREGKWLNTPIDTYNHAIDAIRYVVMETQLGGRTNIDTRRLALRLNR